ncbi:PHLOEM PROTEIN 2 A3 [Biomphalaria glabrata]|nr:PHLOEM PROTEIN 2 A3 [Biomphalaria glabrata]
MEYAIFANTRGYHAFLIILRFGDRFTEEDLTTITILKSVFGNFFIREYCILVMTYGDFYSKDQTLPFTSWCEAQKGKFKDLLTECCHRIVLFDNRATCKKVKDSQVAQLFALVDGLNGNRYTDAHFHQAKESQTLLILQKQKSLISDQTFQETRWIMQKLASFQNSTDDDEDALENLLCRAEALSTNLEGLDKSTGHLVELIQVAYELAENVSVEIKVNASMKAASTEYNKQQVLVTFENEENIERIKTKYARLKADCPNDEAKKASVDKELKEHLQSLDLNFHEQWVCNQEMFLNRKKEERKKLRARHIWKLKKLERKYRDIKSCTTQSLFSTLVETIKWPFRQLISAVLGNVFKHNVSRCF